MVEFFLFHVFGQVGIGPATFGTPTPIPDYIKVPIVAPTGWVMAGILIVVLTLMLFQSLKRFIISLFKKPKDD